MDSQRFDASKRQTSRLNLSIQTGLSDEDEASISSHPNSPLHTPEGSWDSFIFARDSSPDASDSASDSLESSTPPISLTSYVTLEDDINPKTICQTDVFDKGPGHFVTTRTIIRPMPRSPLLSACFSRPSSPVTSRPSSPISFSRPSSPINFAALNCFAASDAFAEEADYIQAQRARELEGRAEVEVHVHQVVSYQSEAPWIVQKVAHPEGLRRRAMEPRGIVSSG
ncbi:hypothetical protein C8R44DRAFT_875185 [Mycena epipterygia]|nr:hypothetical protein C8R44DRAFT_875185 [Mycena epipterygia]